jgi:hypothetical protein
MASRGRRAALELGETKSDANAVPISPCLMWVKGNPERITVTFKQEPPNASPKLPSPSTSTRVLSRRVAWK